MNLSKYNVNEDFDPECIADKKAQQDHLGSLWIHALVNDEEFDSEKYGDDSVKRQSRIVSYQMPRDIPVWVE